MKKGSAGGVGVTGRRKGMRGMVEHQAATLSLRVCLPYHVAEQLIRPGPRA